MPKKVDFLSLIKYIPRKEDGHFEACDLGEQYMNGDITIYTAPEVLVRQAPNQASDYYSLGLILYQMMIGRVT